MKKYFLKRFLKMAITIAIFHFLLSSILAPFCISTRLSGTQSPLLSEFHVINHLAYLLMGIIAFPLGILAKVAPTLYSFLKLPAKGIPIWVQVEVLLLLNSLLASSIFSACFASVSTFMKLIKNQTTEKEHLDSSDSGNDTGHP
ncbi:MAG: hypothetical protein LWX51_07105 [Deltaproteobacteria bacterium]|jgi:hypothetical protein|nr:hypothetical protein [Deltaproteobacteria bacterium]